MKYEKRGNIIFFYVNDTLENVYNRAIKKYTECEIAVSNMFIDTKNRYGSISYLTGGHVFSAHTDIKEESYNKTKIDVYGGFSKGAHGGMIGDFIKITEYVAKNKSGCP